MNNAKNGSKNPFLSIIVTTYNHSSYAKQALDSILMQKTDYTYEILIGDDASSDGTQDILKAYAQKYPDKIKLFLRESNVGATRNAYGLLAESKGKYLATLEGDDYWTDCNKLQKQIDFLENNTEFIGTCHRFDTVNHDGNLIYHKMRWIKHKTVFSLKDFKGIYQPSQQSSFVRRNIYLNKSKNYDFLYKIDDAILDRTEILLLLSKGDFYCFDDIMGAYRVASMSSITQKRYYNNRSALRQDLRLTVRLEKLAEELHIDVDFSGHRKDLYVSAIIRCMKSLCREDTAILKDIRGGYGVVKFIAYVPVGILNRGIRRCQKALYIFCHLFRKRSAA